MMADNDQKSLPQGGLVQAQGTYRACPWCSNLFAPSKHGAAGQRMIWPLQWPKARMVLALRDGVASPCIEMFASILMKIWYGARMDRFYVHNATQFVRMQVDQFGRYA